MSRDHHFGDEVRRREAIQLVEQFEEMLRNNENYFFNHQSLLHIVQHYEEKFEFDKALDVLDYAIEIHPFSANFLVKKAQLLFESKDCEGALELLDKAKIFAPSDLDAALLTSEIYTSLSEFEEAYDTVQNALLFADVDDKVELYLALSETYEQWGKQQEAFNTIKEALYLKPTHEDVLNRIDFLTDITENFAASIRLHKALIDEEPYCHLAWYNLGSAYYGLGLYEKAIEAYEFVIVIDESYDLAYRDMGDAYTELEQYAKAQEAYLEALKASEPDDELYYNIALCCYELDDLASCINYCKQAITINLDYHEAYFQIGTCYHDLEQFDEALRYYEKALKLDEENAEYLATVGDWYFDVENYEMAIILYLKAVNADGLEEDYWVNLVSAYFKLGWDEQVLHVLRKVMAEKPELECTDFFYYLLTAALLKNGLKSEAYLFLEEALTLHFDKHAILFELLAYLESNPEFNLLIEQYKV